jgi:hypothetical protein
MLIFPPFHHWPDEAAIVGRLLVDYGELEIELALSMGYALSDKRKVMRDFFRTRGAEARIKLAEEQANPEEGPWMRLTGVGDEFAEAIAAMRVCKDIRNGFAHCYWISEKSIPECPPGLYFVDVEAWAKSPTPIGFQWQYAGLPRLQELEAYFKYTHECLQHVLAAISTQRGQPVMGECPMPSKRPAPALSCPVSSEAAVILARYDP